MLASVLSRYNHGEIAENALLSSGIFIGIVLTALVLFCIFCHTKKAVFFVGIFLFICTLWESVSYASVYFVSDDALFEYLSFAKWLNDGAKIFWDLSFIAIMLLVMWRLNKQKKQNK